MLVHYKNNKKNRLLSYLCLSLALLTSSPIVKAEAATSRQDVQKMRTLATSVTANVLIYFNLNGIPYDTSNGETYKRNMTRLLELSGQFGSAPINEQIRLLDKNIADLRNLPQASNEARSILPAYSRWLPQVLEAHVQLETSLSGLYDGIAPRSERQSALQGLSHDLGRLLLYYQRASFPYLGAAISILDEETAARLDASVERRFAELSAQDAGLARALEVPVRDYRFVRKLLLTPGQWAPNAVERYLMRAMQALDAEARR